jgi:hypothetical protein
MGMPPRVPPPTDPRFFLAFSLYALFLAFFGALLVECCRPQHNEWTPWHWALGAALIFGVLVVLYDRRFKAPVAEFLRPKMVTLGLAFNRNVKPRRGLVLLVSSGAGVNSGMQAILHHAVELEHLWLIHDENSVAEAQELEQSAKQSCAKLKSRTRLGLPNILVETALKDAADHGLGFDDVICDFTAMPKPVSVGMVLACVGPERRLEYMELNGRPIEMRLDYELERARE